MTRGRGRGKTKSRGGQDPAKQLEHTPSENVDPNEQPASQLSQQDASGFCVCKEEPVEPDNTLPAIGTLTTIQTPNIKMEHKDWQIKKDLVTCSSYMLKEEINTDVSFSVGKEGTLIKAHKLILAMRSPVFERMFFGAFPEAQNPIPLPDVEPSAFRNLLAFVYSDIIDVQLEDSLVTLYVAKKYMMPGLEEAARNILIANLSVDNLWEAYTYCIQWDDKVVLPFCMKYILGNAEMTMTVLNSENLYRVPQCVVLDIVKLHCPEKMWEYDGSVWKSQGPEVWEEEYQLPYHVIYISDIELFKVCNKWASAECLRQKIPQSGANKRKVLGECLHYIQFPLMLPSDIANIVSPSGILTKGEITSLYIHLLPNHENTPIVKPGMQSLVLSAEASPMKNHFTTTGGTCESKINIKSSYRLLLSKIWMTGTGGPAYHIPQSIQLSLIDKAAETVLLKLVKTKVHDQDFDDHLRPLGCVSFEPLVLKENCQYVIGVKHSRHRDKAIVCSGLDESESEGVPLSHLAHSKADLSVSVTASTNNCIAAIAVSFV